MRTITLLGIRIVLHPVWLAVFALLVIALVASFPSLGPPPLEGRAALGTGILAAVLFMGSVVLHELAHAIVARSLGERVSEARVLALGLPARPPATSAPPGRELLSALGGPLLSAGLGILLVGLALAMPRTGEGPSLVLHWGAWWLGLANLALAAFQLIPALPLDGGRVVLALARALTREEARAASIAAAVGRTFGYAVVAAGLFLAFTGEILAGLWLLLLGWSSTRLARASFDRQRMGRLARGSTVADATMSEVPTVPPSLTLDALMSAASEEGAPGVFPVVGPEGLSGVLYTARLRRWSRSALSQLRAAQAMVPLDRLTTLHLDDPLLAAIEALETGGHEALPVVDRGDGRLLGLVTRARVLERLRAREALARARESTAGRAGV